MRLFSIAVLALWLVAAAGLKPAVKPLDPYRAVMAASGQAGQGGRPLWARRRVRDLAMGRRTEQ